MRQAQGQSSVSDVIVDLLNSLSAIRGLSELNSQAASEKELIFKALSILICNQDMERCSFFILDEEQCLVNLTGISSKEYSGAERTARAPLKFKMGQGIIGQAAKTGELQQCMNCKEDKRFFQQTEDMSPGSVISGPIFAAGELVGVLNISHPEVNYFSEWHIRLLHIYKNMMGELIANYRLLQRMEEQIAVRTRHLERALEDVRLLKEHHENMSMRDELTGLYNRRYFYAQIETALARSRSQRQALCLMVLDLDHFKEINDVYGHGFGDTVLKDVSRAIKEEIRESDILARFGGEEFVMVFTNMNDSKGQLFAERIRKKIESLRCLCKQQPVRITASIGLYCLTEEHLNQDDLNIDLLIHYADKALYAAKAAGRNRIVLFTEAGQGNK